jgi:hypothetical protein
VATDGMILRNRSPHPSLSRHLPRWGRLSVRNRLWDHGRNDRAKPFVLDRRGRRSLQIRANKVRKPFVFLLSFRPSPFKNPHHPKKQKPFPRVCRFSVHPVGKVLGRGEVWRGETANFSRSEIRIATEGCDFFTQRRFPLSKVLSSSPRSSPSAPT